MFEGEVERNIVVWDGQKEIDVVVEFLYMFASIFAFIKHQKNERISFSIFSKYFQKLRVSF